jgi:hypothetical protein
MEKLVYNHMESAFFMNVIYKGGPWSVFISKEHPFLSSSMMVFECQGKRFFSELPMCDLADIACGVLDHLGFRYSIFIGGKTWDRPYYNISACSKEVIEVLK